MANSIEINYYKFLLQLESTSATEYSYSEQINFYLSTFDQFKNFREALWQVSALEVEVRTMHQ